MKKAPLDVGNFLKKASPHPSKTFGHGCGANFAQISRHETWLVLKQKDTAYVQVRRRILLFYPLRPASQGLKFTTVTVAVKLLVKLTLRKKSIFDLKRLRLY